jgi:arylsulfatase
LIIMKGHDLSSLVSTLYLKLILTFFTILFLFSCGSEPEGTISLTTEKGTPYLDICTDRDNLSRESATRLIDPLNPDHFKHFLSGWHFSTGDQVKWGNGQPAEIMFTSPAYSDLDLKLFCLKPVSLRDKKLVTKIYSNGNYIGDIEVLNEIKQHGITVPSEYLLPGRNLLRFEPNCAGRPIDVGMDFKDDRNLSIGIERVLFEYSKTPEQIRVPNIDSKDPAKVLQTFDQLLFYYLKVPENGKLRVKADYADEITAHVRIESDGGNIFDSGIENNRLTDIPLTGFENQLAEICLYAKIKEPAVDLSNPIEWTCLQVVQEKTDTPAKENKENPEKRTDWSDAGIDVIYIVFDAFSASHSSLYGYHRPTTPFLERLGDSSVVFENFYANSPYTLASTGTLMTSQYSHKHGLIKAGDRLTYSFVTFPETLANSGIDTYLITSHSWFKEDFGLKRGYDSTYIYDNDLAFYDRLIEDLRKIYQKKDGRKFIYMHLIPPHAPYSPPEEYRIFEKKTSKKIETTPQNFRKLETGEIDPDPELLEYIESMYDSNILFADSISKKIFDLLEKEKIADRALIIITSDHGEACKMEHGFMDHNTTIFEEMVKIPMIMHFPEKFNVTSKRLIPDLASVVDMAPTILDLFGIKNGFKMNGASLLPLIFSGNAESDGRFVYFENLLKGQLGIRYQDYKYIATNSEKLLFDLEKDPFEKVNLAPSRKVTERFFYDLIRNNEFLLFPQKSDEEGKLKITDEKVLKELRDLGYIK